MSNSVRHALELNLDRHGERQKGISHSSPRMVETPSLDEARVLESGAQGREEDG